MRLHSTTKHLAGVVPEKIRAPVDRVREGGEHVIPLAVILRRTLDGFRHGEVARVAVVSVASVFDHGDGGFG